MNSEKFRRERVKIYKKLSPGGIKTIDEYEAFIKDINVPKDVKEDTDTKRAKRDNVNQRRIAVAFPLDEKEDLTPIEGAKTVPTVCSFLPLTEEASGLKFLIHGDFIAHHGRTRMRHRAKWNEWLVHEVGKLAKDAINELMIDRKFQRSYTKMLEFTEHRGEPSWEELFKPILIDGYLSRIPVKYLTTDGRLELPENVVMVKPRKFHDEVFSLIGTRGLQEIYGEGAGFLDPTKVHVRDQDRSGIKEINPLGIAKNRGFLEQRMGDVEWFLKLYKAVKTQADIQGARGIYVLTEDGRILSDDEVYFNELPRDVEELRKEASEVKGELSKGYPFIHPRIEEELKDFFKGQTNVSKIDLKRICKDIFIPELKKKPEEEVKLKDWKAKLPEWTEFVKRAGISGEGIYVLTEDDDAKIIQDVYLNGEYSPPRWSDELKSISIDFISEKYKDRYGDIEGWRKFFLDSGVGGRGEDYENLAKNLLNQLNAERVCKLSKEEMVSYTRVAFDVLPFWRIPEDKIWVLTEDHEIEKSNKVFLSQDYVPNWNWKENEGYVPYEFISPRYIRSGDDPGEWHRFMERFGVMDVEERGSKAIEKFAVEFVKDKIVKPPFKYRNINDRSDERGLGYDIDADSDDGKKRIEVKGIGLDRDRDVALEDNEPTVAREYKKNYELWIINGIPERPKPHRIVNPIEDENIEAKISKVTIPEDDWMKYQID